jgi:exonuclease III/phage gp16-like protein
MNRTSPTKKIKIIHWNCFKLNQNKCKEIEYFLIDNSPDILCLNEVKLDENRANCFLKFTNYTTIYKPRPINSNHGGGVAILIKSDLDIAETNIFSNLKLEIVEIKIKLARRDCYILAYYNPPNVELSEVVFKTLSNANFNYIVCGDLSSKTHSIGCLNDENEYGKNLEQILVNYNGQVINKVEPTYFQSGTLYKEMLDLIICSPLLASTLSSFRVLKDSVLQVVDHEPVEAVFDLAPQRHADTPIVNKFDYNRANWVKFKTILQNLSMDENTVNGLNKKITNEILVAAEESIPVITNAKKSSNLPPFILSMIKKRREIRARTRETNQATAKTECNKIKKEINAAIGKKIDTNWNKFIKKCGRSPLSAKPFWKRINDFRSNQTNKSIPTLAKNGANYESDSEKASAFSEMLDQIFNDNDSTSFDENFKRKIEENNAKFNYSNANLRYNQILPIDIVIAIKELPLGSSPVYQMKCSKICQKT